MNEYKLKKKVLEEGLTEIVLYIEEEGKNPAFCSINTCSIPPVNETCIDYRC